MKALCLTVDLDRDSNLSVPGQRQAGSLDRGEGAAPRFSSSEKGLGVLSDLLDEMGIKATFFAEGRTITEIEVAGHLSGHEVGIHGLDHEDLTTLDPEGKREILNGSMDMVKDITGHDPICSRAPFMKADDEMFDILAEIGIRYDSSMYSDIGKQMLPYNIGRICEIPVPEGLDHNGGKISAYMWPMHEGKRSPSDYANMASGIEEGIFNIATHTWHMVESRKDGPMSMERMERNVGNVGEVLGFLLDMGFKAMTIPEAVRSFPAHR